MNEEVNLSEVLIAPLGSFIREIGKGIACAQRELDDESFKSQMLIKKDYPELAELGYVPQWYTIPSVEAEIKIAMYYEEKKEDGTKKLLFHTINAKTNSFFKAEGASVLKIKIVSTPPPMQLTTPEVK